MLLIRVGLIDRLKKLGLLVADFFHRKRCHKSVETNYLEDLCCFSGGRKRSATKSHFFFVMKILYLSVICCFKFINKAHLQNPDHSIYFLIMLYKEKSHHHPYISLSSWTPSFLHHHHLQRYHYHEHQGRSREIQLGGLNAKENWGKGWIYKKNAY